MRIILISTVRPEPTSGGQIVLHRHLANQQCVAWEVVETMPVRFSRDHVVCSVVNRLKKTGLHRYACDFQAWREGLWMDGLLPKNVPASERAVVLTVAHEDACLAARRFALEHRLPLVTFFHDWWPDMPKVHAPARALLESQFRQLYQDSSLALCVSEKMKALLGPHSNAQVLLPIPSKNGESAQPFGAEEQPFRVAYFGNLNDYGPMMGRALETLKGHAKVRLEVRGPNPEWSVPFQEEMQREGLWHDYAPLAEVKEWFGKCHAFLVGMLFEPEMRRRMETSFPSKMLEMAQHGKPLVIWGPEYCSAVQWARQGDRALCITDPNPAALRQALERLAAAPEEQQRLAAAARQAAQTDFNPDRIQAQFMEALQLVAAPAK